MKEYDAEVWEACGHVSRVCGNACGMYCGESIPVKKNLYRNRGCIDNLIVISF
jgi:hypothetical protein